MTPAETLLSKLLRYAFFGWLLKPPTGDIYTSHAQVRQNRLALKRWLPHYVKVHAVLLSLAAGLFWLAAQLEGSDAVLCGAGCLVVAEGCVAVYVLCAWLAVKVEAWDDPRSWS